MVYTPRQQAPGELERLERFCNSARFLYSEDALTTPTEAAGWLHEHGFTRRNIAVTEQGLRTLVELRETIRDLLGGEDTRQAAATLNRLAGEVLAGPDWNGSGEPGLAARATDPQGTVLADLLTALFDAGVRGELARLKPCHAPECRWVFYDRSPRGNSIWCSMQICGARHKMRNYRMRG